MISVLLGAVAAHAASTPGVSDAEVLLGQSAVFTGPSAGLGSELWRGAQAYFDSVNASGGVHGRKIRVISRDDRYDGDVTLTNTFAFLREQSVFALFGYVGTPTLVKALPLLQRFSQEGIFLFSDFTGSQPQREPPHDQYVFNVRSSYRQETKALVDHFVLNGLSRIGVFVQDDAYGRSGSDGVRRALRAHGLTLTKEVTYARGSPVSTPMMDQVDLLLAAKSEAVISVGSYAACAAFIRDMRTRGFEGPIANLSFVGADALLEILVAEGARLKRDFTGKLVNSQVVPPPSDTSVPLVRDYLATMEKFAPRLPAELRDPSYVPRAKGFVSLEGYLNAKLFTEILRRVPEPLTREGFVRAANSLGTFDVGLREHVTFTAEDHQALDTVYFTTIDHGENVPLMNWEKLK